MQTGYFFSLDGVDGAGKSTQLALFCEWLRAAGHDVVTCRDPGSTPVGEAIREILLDRTSLVFDQRCEMLLYMAARAQLVEAVIRPALARGATVVSDRYLLANVVYQAHAGGLSVDETWNVGRVATAGVLPDQTFVLDVPVDVATARLDSQRKQRDRIESRGIEFLGRVRAGFLAEAARDPDRILIIDASRPAEEVQQQIRAAAHSRVLTR